MNISHNLHFLKFLTSVLVICLSVHVQADGSGSAWAEFKSQQQTDFRSYVSEQDKAFGEYLAQQWEAFEVFKGKVRDITPKPKIAPSAKHQFDDGKVGGAPVQREMRQPDNESNKKTSLFFGHDVSSYNLSIPENSLPVIKYISSESISQAWESLSKQQHQNNLDRIERVKDAFQLGDWGVYLFLEDQFKNKSFTGNSRDIYLWFILNKAGYNVRLAYDKENIYLLFPSEQEVYGKSFITVNSESFYMFGKSFGRGPLMSYQKDYDQNSLKFDLSFNKTIGSTDNNVTRSISYAYEQHDQNVSLSFNTDLASLLNQYPQIGLENYFKAKPSRNTINSFKANLLPKLKNMSPRNAINHLLSMLHFGFAYARDEDQFGRENYMAAEETLYYPASDCEDRAVLLAWLVTELLNLEVIGLDYPGHVSMAVKLPNPVKTDDTIMWSGESYVIADPTYIGARVGEAMAAYKYISPKVISF